MKNFIFLVGTTNNWELGSPRPSWIDKILLPHLCIVCFITFWPFIKANLILKNFNKNLGFGQTPLPPCWAKCPSFSGKKLLRAPLMQLVSEFPGPQVFLFQLILYFESSFLFQFLKVSNILREKSLRAGSSISGCFLIYNGLPPSGADVCDRGPL